MQLIPQWNFKMPQHFALGRRTLNDVSGEEYSWIPRSLMLVQRKSNFQIYSLPRTHSTAPPSKGNDLFTNNFSSRKNLECICSIKL